MRVSVLVSNYNYGRFLAAAIDSALEQTYPDCEVVVVDDGSTDESREVLASYDGRIETVLKENAGQASAVNAGFSAASGDVVCLLDADDVFAPEKVAAVAAEFSAHPDAQLVYHQMQPVDETATKKIGKPVPRAVWRGDISSRVARSGGWWPRPTTSSFAFRRGYLERLLPMPTGPEQLWPDTFLSGPAPFLGPVIGIASPLALLRIHGANAWSAGPLHGQQDRDERVRRRLHQYELEFDVLRRTLAQLDVDVPIALDDHPRRRQYRYAADEGGTRSSVALALLRCPSLPREMRWREAVRVALGRW